MKPDLMGPHLPAIYEVAMPPKHKLYMLACATVIVFGMITWCITARNWVGLAVDILVLLYYVPHYIFAIRDLKRGKQ